MLCSPMPAGTICPVPAMWMLLKHAGSMFLLLFSLLLASCGAGPSDRYATQEGEHMGQHPQPSQEGYHGSASWSPLVLWFPLIPGSPLVPTPR